jgi:serine/threonine protein kinase
MPRCGICSEQYPEGARFCEHDGAPLLDETSPVDPKLVLPQSNGVSTVAPEVVEVAPEVILVQETTSIEAAIQLPEQDQDTAEELLAEAVPAPSTPIEPPNPPSENTPEIAQQEENIGRQEAPSQAEPEAPKLAKKYPTAEERIGTMVGTYRLTRKIGEGGMGVVYEAIHPIIERKIAIKLIQPEQADNVDAVRRFFDEARALSRSRHPNIVDIYDLGQLEDGTIFLEMELLSGETLRDRLNQKGPLLLSEILRIFVPIANALKTAHDAGIIHRDLKPENIFLGNDGGLKLLDFGVSKLQEGQTHDGEHTQAGMLVGTPEYMSPEQAVGEHNLDHRADIYSLGIVLYEASCGILPFDATILVDILVNHIQVEFPRPSERARLPIDAALEATIMKCIAKSPEARFRSMGELVQALNPIQPKTPSISFMRDSFGISQGLLPSQLAPQTGEVTPGDLRRGAPLGPDIKIKGGLWRRIDAANIGDMNAETSHDMTYEGVLTRKRVEGTFPSGRMLTDDGVVHSGPLSVRLKGVAPGRDVLLLLRVDVSQPFQVETLLGDELLVIRQPEVDPEHCWRHETALIPGERIKDGELFLIRTPMGGSLGNLYALWVYQLVSTGPVKPLVL